MAGLDQEILPQFVAGLTYTHRIRKDLIYTTFPGYTSADYVPIDPATLDPSECTPGTHGGCLAYDTWATSSASPARSTASPTTRATAASSRPTAPAIARPTTAWSSR